MRPMRHGDRGGRERAAESPQPARPSARVVAIFAAFTVVAMLVLALPVYSRAPMKASLTAGAVAVLLIALAVQWVAMRRQRPTWLDPVGPWLLFVCIALLRGASGGSGSALGPLLLVPLLWLALFGTRRDLYVGALLTAVTFVVPVLVIGPPDYQFGDLRRAVLWSAFVLLLLPVVQQVVRELAVERRRERQSAAQLRGIMRGATLSALVSTDLAGTITSFNAGAERLLGYDAEEVVGRRGPALFHDPDEIAEAARELGVQPGAVLAELARRRASSRVWTYVRKDGSRLFVRLAMTELFDEDEQVVGHLAVAIDATNAITTRRELIAAEERWRVVMSHLPDAAVVVVDEDLTVQLVTGLAAERQGMTDAAGKPLADFSSNAALLEPLVREALHGRDGVVEGQTTTTGDEMEFHVSPLPAADGSGPRAIVLARDVSRERARERALEASRDRAERLFVDAPHGIAVLDVDGGVRVANPALCVLLGRPAHEVAGRPLASFGDPDDHTVQRHLSAVLDRSSHLSEADWAVRRPDGETAHVSLSSTLLEGRDGDEVSVLVNAVDTTELHRHQEQLAHLADHDPLTGLANRRRFSAELSRHLEFCRRYGARGALLLLDLDHFKDVNDTLGHSVGDELIVSIAGLLRSSVRSTDLVARLGGDEFAILLMEGDRAATEVVAEKVVTTIRNVVTTLDGAQRHVTASVGAVMVDERNEGPSELLAVADMTMYDAKEAGRDQWHLLDYEVRDRPRTGAHIEWTSRITRALARGDFVLHLQPIWDIHDGRVSGAEVLLRMVDGDALVYPNRFLYVAERSELVNRIDEWVLHRSIGLLAELQKEDARFHLEVNLSGRSIGHPGLERSLRAALEEHHVDPAGLVLEITETAAVADVKTARAFAERITALGCRFALDDFGAGFGSFYYLKHLLFDYVKIDGEFVAHCHASPTDRAIVNSIVGIAHGLGKKAIAEYVSEPAILEVVREEGVDFAQGYHIGKPIAAEQFCEQYLRGPGSSR